MAGQVRNANPGGNKEAGVVGDEAQIFATLRMGPSDEIVTPGHLPGGGPEKHGPHGSFIGIHSQVGDIFAHAGGKTQIMIALQKGLPKIPVCAFIRDHQTDRPEFGKRTLQKTGVVKDGLERFSATMIGAGALWGRQFKESSAMKLEEHRATCHVLDLSRGCLPLPHPAKFLGQTGPIPTGILTDQILYARQVGWGEGAALYDNGFLHEQEYAKAMCSSPAKNLFF